MTTKATETLPDIIASLEDDGVSLEQIAAAVNKVPMAIRHWRDGKANPHAKCWHQLAKLSGRTVEEIACAIARGVKPVPGRGRTATPLVRSRR